MSQGANPPGALVRPAAPTARSRLRSGAGIVATAFALRLLFASLAVSMPQIVAQTRLSPFGAGLLTTLPVLCLGLLAPLAPRLARRFGVERTLAGAMGVLALCTALRGLGPVWLLLACSVVAAGAIACGNVLLPGLVKRDFPDRPGLLTGLYVMALSAGAALAAATTVPLERAAAAGWGYGLAIWALPVLPALLIWRTLARPPAPGGSAPAREGAPWRSLLAWQVTMFMGLQSALAFSVFGWLAVVLRERGLDAVTAGLVVSALIIVQLGTSLTIPSIAARWRGQRLLAVALTLAGVGGLLGLLYAPLGGVWLWALLQGAGQGGLIALALTMMVLRAEDAEVAAQLSSMAQTIGYVPAALAPLAIGLLRTATGGFAATGFVFALIALGLLWSGMGAGRALRVERAALSRRRSP